MENRSNKPFLRQKLQSLRENLSNERRREAEKALFASFHATSHQNILSFVSFSGEIETTLLNRTLAEQGRLLLPKMVGSSLEIYRVSAHATQLEQNACGLWEPIPSQCEHVLYDTIDMVLVPGLGFTPKNHRIGYGKGFYDRFLPKVKCKAFGIGFKEQLLSSLPVETTDFPLDSLFLF